MSSDLKNIKLIIGLGNNDKKYNNTFHNVGHLFVENWKGSLESLKNNGYMNNAGSFVAQTTRKKGVSPEELLIVHDDADLMLGEYKLDMSKGSAGHKGVESVIQALKTKNFWRLRIGIRKEVGFIKKALGIRLKAKSFVLKNMTKADREVLEGVFGEINKELT